MQQLPKGYYAVLSDWENSAKDCFTFRGVTYGVTEGVNLFPDIFQANAHAEESAECGLEGLNGELFSAPVLLFSEGKHSIDRFQFDKSVILLGQGAGISPNLPAENRLDPPLCNPDRMTGESVLSGSFWFGNMEVKDPRAESILVDGFSSAAVRFRDSRRDGGNYRLTFRNIIHLGPCGRTLYFFAGPSKDTPQNREVLLENIRLKDYDDFDYGGMFTLLNAKKAVLDHIYYDGTGQFFGLTTLTHKFENCSDPHGVTDYRISNCYFRNLDEGGIGTDCKGTLDGAVNLTVEHCVFLDAGKKDRPVLRPHVPNDRSHLTVTDCIFEDSKPNGGAAVSVIGSSKNVVLKDCSFKGFAKEWVLEPPLLANAPDFMELPETEYLTKEADPHRVSRGTPEDFEALDRLYEGRTVSWGDLHVHTDSGGTSDGLLPIGEWPKQMDEKKLDFAAVVDHKQMRGFFLPEWDEKKFIIGTEPGTYVQDLNACRSNLNTMHYIMLFPHKYGLAMVLANFPEFQFHGTETTGSFKYPKFTKARFLELTQYVQSIGGIMIHPHPKTMLASDDPLDFYIGEHTFLETLYESPESHASYKNYALWKQILDKGFHVYTSGGTDTHTNVSNKVVSAFYTKEKNGRAYFDRMHTADFTVGAVAMKMCIDGNPMGSELTYKDGMTLTLRTGEFFGPNFCENHAYELRIFSDRGLIFRGAFNGTRPQAVKVEVQKRRFYRAEIFDLTDGYPIAIGNPIWLDGDTYCK